MVAGCSGCCGASSARHVLPAAATQHAEVRVSMAGFTISDLGGGLRVNGVALQQHLLRHDDLVELGPAHFLFREG